MKSIEIQGNWSESFLKERKIALVTSQFNLFITNYLSQGAKDVLSKFGIAQVLEPKVPGAYEIPLFVQQIAESKCFNGIIAFGAILSGQTSHADLLRSICLNRLADISFKKSLPIATAIVTNSSEEVSVIESLIARMSKKKLMLWLKSSMSPWNKNVLLFYSPFERIVLSHQALDCRVFSSGALFAARWQQQKQKKRHQKLFQNLMHTQSSVTFFFRT